MASSQMELYANLKTKTITQSVSVSGNNQWQYFALSDYSIDGYKVVGMIGIVVVAGNYAHQGIIGGLENGVPGLGVFGTSGGTISLQVTLLYTPV